MASATSNPDLPRRGWRARTAIPLVTLALAGVAVAVATADPTGAGAAGVHAPLTRVGTQFQVPGGLRVRGWAFDPDAKRTSLRVFSTVDGHYSTAVTATKNRPKLARKHPSAGPRHGFSLRVRTYEGRHRVCVLARNLGRGKNATLGCWTRTFDYGPYGRTPSVGAVPGHLRVRGWAIDNDRPASPVTTVVRVDGVRHTVAANRYRTDTARVHAGAGSHHGYDASIRVGQGTHRVCVTAKNIGYGTDNSLGCRTVTLNDDPVVKINKIAQDSGKLRIRGWAFDRDAPTTPLRISERVDSAPARVVTANVDRDNVAQSYPRAGRYHGFNQYFALAEGTHRVCVRVVNIGYGSDVSIACRTVRLNFTPSVSLTSLAATKPGVKAVGWATDPDTTSPISARITLDGHAATTTLAKGSGSTHRGHNFTASLATKSGPHQVCATAVNALYGHADSAPSCRSITLALKPFGYFDTLTRSGANLRLSGWTFDPDSAAPTTVVMTLDGTPAGTLTADGYRPGVAAVYPSAGRSRGFTGLIPADDGEHRVCLVARNVGPGADASLGCKIINAVHPVVPSAPRSVTAAGGYGSATVRWTAPVSDGGAPWTRFTVYASPGGRLVSVGAGARSATVTGLASKTSYTFAVRAVNIAGTSPAGTSPRTTTQTGPAPQKTPAPISTSRYIRNIRGSSAAELATMRAEGAADARANPSGHRYLVLLDIGGQNQYYNGVVLSATTRFVTYADLIKDVKAYIDGYHSAQKATAPVLIAVGTNNDMDVNATTGKVWATAVVNPLASYAGKYSGLSVAGANDIEPGFSASYGASRNWLTGYLGAAKPRFVFNGSADGCAWTVTNRGCNNGWTMAGLYNLAAGAAPARILNLPQVYNYTMADQWKFISLTGVGQGKARINFGGPLTEYTACAQAGSCGSLGGRSAWQRLWNDLQSHSKLKVSSLPYATDLRIDR